MSKRGGSPNKSDQIYYTVRNDIVRGEYPGGTFLTEAELCTQFSVSRTPVREALIRLSQDGFVQLIPNRGAVIPHVTITDIIDILHIRAANEGLAAYLVAKNASEPAVKKLETSVAREEKLLSDDKADPLVISREDFEFHHLLADCCGNHRLAHILGIVDNQMHRFAHVSADTLALETLSISVRYHRQVLDAIRDHDSAAARHAIEEHWMAMRDGYIQRSLSGSLSALL